MSFRDADEVFKKNDQNLINLIRKKTHYGVQIIDEEAKSLYKIKRDSAILSRVNFKEA
jgi:hypothetical protein